MGAQISIHPVSPGGIISEASHVFSYNLTHPGPGTNDSQIASNPHEAVFDPSGLHLFVANRDADRVYVYRVNGPTDVVQIANFTLEPGTGPRDITFKVFNETRTYVYLVSELDNSVRVFTLDYCTCHLANSASATLTIILKQRISTLNARSTRTAPNTHGLASETIASNDSRFLYFSNRNTISMKSDTVTVYSIHPAINDDLRISTT